MIQHRAMASERAAVAYHEAGHAVANVLACRNAQLPPWDDLGVDSAEIVVDGEAWGGLCSGTTVYHAAYVTRLPSWDWRDAMEWQIVLDMAGGIAEAIHRGERRAEAFYNECHYQAMLRECANADVVFAAHELLFKLPAAIGEFGLVIIDEAFWEKGLFGEDVKHPTRLNIADLVDELNDYPVNKRVDGPSGRKISVKDEERTAELRALLERLQKALTGKPVGYIRREYLVAVGLDDDFRRARILEWARKVDLDVRSGDDIDGYKAAAAQHGEFAGSIKRRVDMWRALENFMRGDEEATGWLSIQNDDTKQGRVKQLEIMGCRPIDPKLRRLPIIHADATLQLEISRYYLPRLRWRSTSRSRRRSHGRRR